jgi:hypothetical protein
MAAMPSLHVAFPALLGLWFLREEWRAPGIFLLAYAAVVAFEVVISGEHYVIDVVAAFAFAAFLAIAFQYDYARLARRFRQALRGPRPARAPETHQPEVQTSLRAARANGRERAQTLIEFAFVAPLFFVFLFSIVDFGIAIDRRLVLQHGVREGARYGAVHTNISDIEDYTVDQSQGIIDTADVSVCYLDKNGNGNPGNIGDAVEVDADLTYEFPIMREIFGAFGIGPLSIDMTPHGTARLEQTVTGATAC